MTSVRPRFDPSPEIATVPALEMALRPFIDRLLKEDRRERAVAHFLPKLEKSSYHELVTSVDTTRARPCDAASLEPWKAVRGVFLVDHEAYAVTAQQAMDLYLTGTDALFVAYSGTFAVVRYQTGSPLLLT
ncbi:MAG: hypothetical protein IPQ07_06755 [Myxococcales bacterium]|nr:hypothetical protein [Myxococcales bacterium]